MQFNARAYPSLIPSNGDVVKVNVIGKDRDGTKLERAKRIGMFMSYQVLYEMHCWEEDMDKLLMMLPIIGTVFKKTYYNPVIKQNVSELVLPENLVVNYWAKSLESAERVSEIIPLSKRLVKEKMMSKTYLDVELGDPIPDPTQMTQAVAQDEATPYQIIEQHTYLDLDEDGYAEPYVVTFERTSGKVLRSLHDSMKTRFTQMKMAISNVLNRFSITRNLDSSLILMAAFMMLVLVSFLVHLMSR